jgi:hypothetical protein
MAVSGWFNSCAIVAAIWPIALKRDTWSNSAFNSCNRSSDALRAASAALRSVISTIADSTITPSSVSIGFNPISTGNSLPFFLIP